MHNSFHEILTYFITLSLIPSPHNRVINCLVKKLLRYVSLFGPGTQENIIIPT